MHDKLTSEIHQNAARMYRVIKYGAHLSISCGHMTVSTMAATTTVTLNQGKKKWHKGNIKQEKIWGVCVVPHLKKARVATYKELPCLRGMMKACCSRQAQCFKEIKYSLYVCNSDLSWSPILIALFWPFVAGPDKRPHGWWVSISHCLSFNDVDCFLVSWNNILLHLCKWAG